MKRLQAVILTTLALIICACASIRPAPPEVQLSSLEITDFSLSHANFLATLRLYNPNNISLDVEGLKFTLYLNDVQVAKGQTARTFSLPAEDFGSASIRLSSSFLELLQLTQTFEGQDTLGFRIIGEVEIGGPGVFGVSIPIEREGSLPLTGTLQQLLPIEQRD